MVTLSLQFNDSINFWIIYDGFHWDIQVNVSFRELMKGKIFHQEIATKQSIV